MTVIFIGTTEIIIIAAVILLLFGGKKVPELMKGLGKGVKSFKQGMNEPFDEEKPEEMTHENAENIETIDRDKSGTI